MDQTTFIVMTTMMDYETSLVVDSSEIVNSENNGDTVFGFITTIVIITVFVVSIIIKSR